MRLLVARQRRHVKGLPIISRDRPSAHRACTRAPWPRLLACAACVCLAACRLEPPLLERAALLASRGQAQQAAALLDEHLASHPEGVAERRMLIRLYGSLGQLGVARAQTERLVEQLGPRSPVPWVELGHAHELAHQYDEALGAYDRAAEVAPEEALGPKRGGMRAARWGELGLAAPRLEEALRRAPEDAEVWHALGLVRMGLGQLDGARAAYEGGIAVDPQRLDNHLGLATVALALGTPRTALEQYELLLRARPNHHGALLGKSWSLIALGELGAAEAALARAEALGADAASISRQRRAIAERRGQLR